MELCEVYPLGPVVDGVALNVTVQSYRESLFVGINACATTVADLPSLSAAMVDELTLLSRMADRTRRPGTGNGSGSGSTGPSHHHRRGSHAHGQAATASASASADRSGAPG
jgi:hypothetical protein